jgi:hypothetical protein
VVDSTVVTPVAEATKAVAETSGKAIDAASAFAELIGCVEDKFKYIRWERQQALIEKAERRMAEKSLSAPTRDLPLSFSVPLLTHAVIEEDDELQEVWARLLVNAGDSSTPMELRTAYVEVLAGMSAFDVKYLAMLAEVSLNAPEITYLPIIEAWNLPLSAKLHPETSQETGPVSKELGISLSNLNRLGCAAPAYGFGGMPFFQLMTVTELGRALYLACS